MVFSYFFWVCILKARCVNDTNLNKTSVSQGLVHLKTLYCVTDRVREVGDLKAEALEVEADATVTANITMSETHNVKPVMNR